MKRCVLVLVAASAACSSFGAQSSSSGGEQGDGGAADGSVADGGVPPNAGDGGGGSAYEAAVVADQPIAYWRLGDKSGMDLAPRVGTAPAALVNPGGARLGAAGAIANDPDTAVAFAGAVATVTEPTLGFGGTASFTVEAWLSPSAIPPATYMNAIAREVDTDGGADTRNGWSLFVAADGGWGFERWANGANKKAYLSVPPALNRFAHVVGVYDGTDVTLWVDGLRAAQVGSFAASEAVPNAQLIIGAVSAAGTQAFTGSVDEVAVYGHALAEDRIVLHHQLGVGLGR